MYRKLPILFVLLALAPITTSFEQPVPDKKKVYNKPALTVRAFPQAQNVDMSYGCSMVHLTAEIKGPEDERWYCPKVVWTKPDGTRSTEESDCPPFEMRNACYPPRSSECALDWHIEDGRFVVDKNPCDCDVPGFPRQWTLDLCAPAHPEGDMWYVQVRLEKNGSTLAQDNARFLVK